MMVRLASSGKQGMPSHKALLRRPLLVCGSAESWRSVEPEVERLQMDPFFDESRLSGGELQYLHARHPEVIRHIQERYQANMNYITQQSQRLNVPIDELTLYPPYQTVV